jgi:hypothetical protein
MLLSQPAIKNITMREAIVNCNFDEDFFEGIAHPEGYIQDAWFLYNMRKGFELFNEMLGILGDEKEEFILIISGKKKIDDENYGYSEEYEDDDVGFIADDEDNEPV